MAKEDPERNAGRLTTAPWTVAVDGLCARPGSYALDDIVKPARLEERIYRLRCVEGWSMVIPWIGLPLADVIAAAEPAPSAKYVAFETLVRPEEMPGQSGLFQVLDWPYVEGLRLDEAMHPLTILAIGPLRRGRCRTRTARRSGWWCRGSTASSRSSRSCGSPSSPTSRRPPGTSRRRTSTASIPTSTRRSSHPRWSQASERVVGEGLFAARRPTEPFNGYAEAVAGLYAGMDLGKFY